MLVIPAGAAIPKMAGSLATPTGKQASVGEDYRVFSGHPESGYPGPDTMAVTG
jgi:hypothetical protein